MGDTGQGPFFAVPGSQSLPSQIINWHLAGNRAPTIQNPYGPSPGGGPGPGSQARINSVRYIPGQYSVEDIQSVLQKALDIAYKDDPRGRGFYGSRTRAQNVASVLNTPQDDFIGTPGAGAFVRDAGGEAKARAIFDDLLGRKPAQPDGGATTQRGGKGAGLGLLAAVGLGAAVLKGLVF